MVYHSQLTEAFEAGSLSTQTPRASLLRMLKLLKSLTGSMLCQTGRAIKSGVEFKDMCSIPYDSDLKKTIEARVLTPPEVIPMIGIQLASKTRTILLPRAPEKPKHFPKL